MKIGMIAGSIPIPFFINQLILNLASEDHKVFIYGALKSNVKLNKYLFIYFRVQPKLKSIKIIKSFPSRAYPVSQIPPFFLFVPG